MQRRRENGLCFTCDEKYFSSHKCPNKQLLLFQIDDELDEEGVFDPNAESEGVKATIPLIFWSARSGYHEI